MPNNTFELRSKQCRQFAALRAILTAPSTDLGGSHGKRCRQITCVFKVQCACELTESVQAPRRRMVYGKKSESHGRRIC